jgi:fumarate hydratase class II
VSGLALTCHVSVLTFVTSLMLVTCLNPVIGYDNASKAAKVSPHPIRPSEENITESLDRMPTRRASLSARVRLTN